MQHDPCLDTLLDLDGQVIVLPDSGHLIRFRVTRIPASPEKPHGLDYSLTLHSPSGERLVGFDNGPHRIKGLKKGNPRDHKHRIRTVRPYDYSDAGQLLADFYAEVDSVLRERGVLK